MIQTRSTISRRKRGLVRYSRWSPPTGDGWHTQHWCRGVRRSLKVVRLGERAGLTCLVCAERLMLERQRLQ